MAYDIDKDGNGCVSIDEFLKNKSQKFTTLINKIACVKSFEMPYDIHSMAAYGRQMVVSLDNKPGNKLQMQL